MLVFLQGEGEVELLASLLLEASEFAQDLHGVCTRWALIDSAPEPIGRKTDFVWAEVPNVVLHHPGVNDDVRSGDGVLNKSTRKNTNLLYFSWL